MTVSYSFGRIYSAMWISTRARYGIRLMLDLALNQNGKPVRVRDMSLRQEVSEKYVEQLLARLKRAGYVRSVRGAGGGYALARPAAKINVFGIFEALEGSLQVVDCVDDPALCPRYPLCVTHGIWKRIRDASAKIMNSISLEKLAGMHRKKRCMHAAKGGASRRKGGLLRARGRANP